MMALAPQREEDRMSGEDGGGVFIEIFSEDKR